MLFQERVKALYAEKGGLAWKLGFPDRRVESYRKVPLQVVSEFPLAYQGIVKLEGSVPKPVVLLSMEEAKKTYAVFLENRKKTRVSKEKDFFAALVEDIYDQGFFLYIPPNTKIEETISLSFLYSGKDAHFVPHLQIFVGRGAKVKFCFSPKFESFSSGMITQLMDIYLDKNSSCDFVDKTDLPYEAIYMNSVRASLKEGSLFKFWSISEGSKFFRQDFRVELLEERCEAVLKGASDLKGDRVSYTEVLMEHKAPYAKSNQQFKAVMRDQSRSTFEGKIFVAPEAQKTEAYQLNNNLLLGEKSTVFSKPNLEIFADDVKASHGATVTKLSREELFYLQTRGIGKGEAAKFLAKGFLKDITDGI